MESDQVKEHSLFKYVKEEKEADGVAWAYMDQKTFKKYPFKLPDLPKDQVRIRVVASGLCLSDLLGIQSGMAPYPCVPGHEICGVITAVGSEVKDLKVGDKVGFGPIRDCCLNCEVCDMGRENLCPKRTMFDKYTIFHFGGFSTHTQQPALWTFKLPDKIPEKYAASLLCAGITVFAPLQRYFKKNNVVGIIGIGGLGHLGVKFAKKMGNKVIAFSSSLTNEKLYRELGADEVVATTDDKMLASFKDSCDVIINTAPSFGNYQKYLGLMRHCGHFVQVGASHDLTEVVSFSGMHLITKEVNIVGSGAGNRQEHRDMLEFAAKHEVYPMIEEFDFDNFDKAVDRLQNGKPKFRCVVKTGEYSDKMGFK